MSDIENGVVSSLRFSCCDWIRGGIKRVCLSFFPKNNFFFSPTSATFTSAVNVLTQKEPKQCQSDTWLDKCGTGVLLAPVATGLAYADFLY